MASVARAAILAREAASRSRSLDTGQLSRVADTVAYAAAGYGIAPDRLLQASDFLTRCDPDWSPEAADEIRSAAAKVAEEADRDGVYLLAQAALDLAHTAGEFGQAVTEELKAKKMGWSRLWSRKKGKGKRKESQSNGLFDRLLGDSPASSSTAEHPPKEGNLGEYLGYALFGSLALLPYLGPEGMAKTMSNTCRWWFHCIFASWWSIIALGTLCKNSRNRYLLIYAYFADCVGMMGITALVILYSSLLIAPEAPTFSYGILFIAMALHVCYWVMDWCRRL